MPGAAPGGGERPAIGGRGRGVSPFDGMDEALRALEAGRDELAREWLLRVVEEAPLDEIARLRTDRVVEEVPELVRDLTRPADDEAAAELRGRALARLARLRAGRTDDPAEPARDLLRLQSVMLETLGGRLEDPSARATVQSIDGLARSVGELLVDAVSDLFEARSQELEALAHTDALTSLHNLRHLRREMDQLVALQQRYGHSFAVVLLDVDGLKRINDGFGHAVGDRALVGIGEVLRAGTRAVDTAVRMGGDEFCVIAPELTASPARALGERISAAVRRIELPSSVTLSVSAGVASCPEHGVEAEGLLNLADEAMYRAKAAGVAVEVARPAGAARQEFAPADH